MSFYFYDLETTSGNPRDGRIMQFAGQRTDEHMIPIGKPDNILVKLAEDVLPEPDAILVHGITPQKAIEEGITEKEFCDFFIKNIAKKDTIFVGFNNVRFDDEFIRRILYRNFYDPYQWHWQDGKSRWDMLDPIRMMRALRPKGLNWPEIDGKPTVKLELMAKANEIKHTNAHDALSDVEALIELSKRFKEEQTKLFTYLCEMRDKKSVAKLAQSNDPLVYTSGKYSSDYEKTTVVQSLFAHPDREASIVYNLRENPKKWLDKSVDALITHWQARYGDNIERLPVKTLQYNRCPAVAPAGVLDTETQKRLHINLQEIEEHRSLLLSNNAFKENLKKALDIINKKQQAELPLQDNVDEQIYEGFWGNADQAELLSARTAQPETLTELTFKIKNKRIREMIPLYVARNYPHVMSENDVVSWETHKQKVFYEGGNSSKFAKFSKRMQELAKTNLTEQQQYLLTELQLYAESILPEPVDA